MPSVHLHMNLFLCHLLVHQILKEAVIYGRLKSLLWSSALFFFCFTINFFIFCVDTKVTPEVCSVRLKVHQLGISSAMVADRQCRVQTYSNIFESEQLLKNSTGFILLNSLNSIRYSKVFPLLYQREKRERPIVLDQLS